MVSEPKAMIQALLQPWQQAVEDPSEAQRQVLQRLLEGYAETDYGARRGAAQISSIEDYRTAFPIVTYQDLQPVLRRVMEGETAALLAEPVEGWALTRGATGKASRYIPMTRSDLALRARYSPRALLNYVHRTGRYDILDGYCLIQTSPSEVGTLQVGDRQIRYGYSSGLYARQGAPGAQLRLVPTQAEIDALGSGQTPHDWECRFELIYQRAKDKPVTMLVGVAQNMLKFGEFCRRRHGVYPKDIWQMTVLVPTSVAGILTTFRPALRALYGAVDLVEMYASAEAILAQQLDERPYVVPNYDGLLFEAQTRRGMVMLHDMYRGERGSLVVSTPILPRYRIGDVLMCYGQPYFRCLGRERGYHPLRFAFDRFLNSDWESVALMLR